MSSGRRLVEAVRVLLEVLEPRGVVPPPLGGSAGPAAAVLAAHDAASARRPAERVRRAPRAAARSRAPRSPGRRSLRRTRPRTRSSRDWMPPSDCAALLRHVELDPAGHPPDDVVLLAHVDVEVGSRTTSPTLRMSSSLSGLRRRLAGGAAERGAGLAHELVQVAHHGLDVEPAGHVAGLHAGYLLVALVLGLREPAARVEAERPQRAALVLVLRDRRGWPSRPGTAAARSRRPGTSRTRGRRWRGSRS